MTRTHAYSGEYFIYLYADYPILRGEWMGRDGFNYSDGLLESEKYWLYIFVAVWERNSSEGKPGDWIRFFAS